MEIALTAVDKGLDGSGLEGFYRVWKISRDMEDFWPRHGQLNPPEQPLPAKTYSLSEL